jgi:uncharacterized protein YodC (DUF2158 family)
MMALTWKSSQADSIEVVPCGLPIAWADQNGAARLYIHDAPEGWLEAATEAVGAAPSNHQGPDSDGDSGAYWSPGAVATTREGARDALRKAHAAVEDLRQAGAPSQSETIQPGDVVRLRSGSPPMTVTAIDDGLVRVAWWRDGMCRDELHAASVARVDS